MIEHPGCEHSCFRAYDPGSGSPRNPSVHGLARRGKRSFVNDRSIRSAHAVAERFLVYVQPNEEHSFYPPHRIVGGYLYARWNVQTYTFKQLNFVAVLPHQEMLPNYRRRNGLPSRGHDNAGMRPERRLGSRNVGAVCTAPEYCILAECDKSWGFGVKPPFKE